MKNWVTLDADVNRILNKHYTPGRGGQKIQYVVIHHNAGNLTVEGCWSVWQTREASAHYQVEAGGRIGQLVWDKDTAWHAANALANQRSIGIEHANNSTTAWTVSEATLENGAHLVAALCVYYRLGRPVWLRNVFPHNYFAATGCPGALAGAQNARYMARARYWYSQMTRTPLAKAKATVASVKKTVTTTSPMKGKSIDTLAREVIAGKWGAGEARKKALGSQYAAVQARVNQLLGAPVKTTAAKNVDTIAREVIAGKWGNGQDRANRLTKAGYSYNAVQARVNQILLG